MWNMILFANQATFQTVASNVQWEDLRSLMCPYILTLVDYCHRLFVEAVDSYKVLQMTDSLDSLVFKGVFKNKPLKHIMIALIFPYI